jgi:hypothetical protein
LKHNRIFSTQDPQFTAEKTRNKQNKSALIYLKQTLL